VLATVPVTLTTQQPWRREEGNSSFGMGFRTRVSGSIQNHLIFGSGINRSVFGPVA
jgi:hypothetical protein